MRDQADTHTMGLPPIEPEPVPLAMPQRMSEQQRREAQGYAGPKIRPGCWCCRSFAWRVQAPDAIHERLVAYCQRGNFRCDKSGTCDRYTLDPRKLRTAQTQSTPCARAGVYSAEDEAADRADFQRLQDEKKLKGKGCTHAWFTQGKSIEQGIEYRDVVCAHCGDSLREPW